MTHPGGGALPRYFGGAPWDTGQSGTGQCANTDPLLDRINLGIEGSGPVAIMPEAHSTVSAPPDFRASWMARIDGCPSCVENAEAPRWTASTAHGFTAAYTCSDCGHRWSTDWSE